jgi:predicted transposase YdaD
MIESAAYDLIKQEGEQEGEKKGEQKGKILEAREAVLDILEARFEVVPQSIINKLQDVKHLHVLKTLRRKSVTIGTMEEFKQLLERSSA